ncbi:MAG: glycoside hydrolase family 65 protein, partial [Acidimicrobiia bacterium]|nr:glycoside hydrolase family 65 protein [Acidimicrobiia bacterium]
ETARLWEDLGFYANNGTEQFHIHGVTGPDEYTTVVNDNTYTNIMARFNLGFAAWAVQTVAQSNPEAHAALVRRTGVTDDEVAAWKRAANAMFIPYDERLGIHPQDVNFLEREVWDFAGTSSSKYPLLLHFHPLVIYRHQVLKQADVVLAMFLRREHFTPEQRRRNFDYYDPLTTGDSSLSACVQSIVAADVGYTDRAFDYFNQSLYLDLADSHGNTTDGVHVANAGGVWSAIVYGFAGMVDREGKLGFHPRLPRQWTSIRFRLLWRGETLQVTVDHNRCLIEALSDGHVELTVGRVGETPVQATAKPGAPIEISA